MVEHQPSKLDTWVRFPSPASAPLAQLVEHLTLNQGVQGSSPWWRMIFFNNINSKFAKREFGIYFFVIINALDFFMHKLYNNSDVVSLNIFIITKN